MTISGGILGNIEGGSGGSRERGRGKGEREKWIRDGERGKGRRSGSRGLRAELLQQAHEQSDQSAGVTHETLDFRTLHQRDGAQQLQVRV
jgi:hypothetical protein